MCKVAQLVTMYGPKDIHYDMVIIQFIVSRTKSESRLLFRRNLPCWLSEEMGDWPMDAF